jgi:sporulation protein YlmC with PRC-barrel domain
MNNREEVMKRLTIILSILALTGLLSTLTFGADTTTSTSMKTDTGMEQGGKMHSYIRGSELIGRQVVSRSQEELGTVKDLIIGKDGQTNFIVLSHGGVMGVGGDLYPVPFSACEQVGGSSDQPIILGINKKELENAPSFASNDWPDFSNSDYNQKVRGYFSETPTMEKEGTMEMKKHGVESDTMPESK